jgi:hypothetical protein
MRSLPYFTSLPAQSIDTPTLTPKAPVLLRNARHSP